MSCADLLLESSLVAITLWTAEREQQLVSLHKADSVFYNFLIQCSSLRLCCYMRDSNVEKFLSMGLKFEKDGAKLTDSNNTLLYPIIKVFVSAHIFLMLWMTQSEKVSL